MKLWNQLVNSDRTTPNNKPDNIIRKNEKETRTLLEVSILWGALYKFD
jgi:hypothetical protein